MISNHPSPDTKACYIMQQEDIERFADTLADGFCEYSLFKYICNGKNIRNKMRLFWAVSLALVPERAICIADSKEANSVLIYVRPNSKEPGLFDYLRTGGLKMFYKFGIGSIVRLLRFEAEAQRVAKRYKTSNDGYLWAFATRLDKQGQHYATPLVKALLNHIGRRLLSGNDESRKCSIVQTFFVPADGTNKHPIGQFAPVCDAQTWK